jgi:hypothetical protein
MGSGFPNKYAIGFSLQKFFNDYLIEIINNILICGYGIGFAFSGRKYAKGMRHHLVC